MEENNMNYYDTPDQRINPPEMSRADEVALESAEKILAKISELHDFVESYFDEISLREIEKRLNKAQDYLEDLESLYNDTFVVDEEYNSAKWKVEEIEGWLNEKEELIKTEGDK
jgi:hypothetical protein